MGTTPSGAAGRARPPARAAPASGRSSASTTLVFMILSFLMPLRSVSLTTRRSMSTFFRCVEASIRLSCGFAGSLAQGRRTSSRAWSIAPRFASSAATSPAAAPRAALERGHQLGGGALVLALRLPARAETLAAPAADGRRARRAAGASRPAAANRRSPPRPPQRRGRPRPSSAGAGPAAVAGALARDVRPQVARRRSRGSAAAARQQRAQQPLLPAHAAQPARCSSTSWNSASASSPST